MKMWQALVTMNAAKLGLNDEQFEEQLPRLRLEARASLRALGITKKELESSFPDRQLYESLYLIKADPEEFRRQSNRSMQQLIGKN